MPSSSDITLPKFFPHQWPADLELKQHTGSCHCKKFVYEFLHPPICDVEVVSCDCSICISRGYLNIYAPEDYFTFVKGSADELSYYEFNRKAVRHMFCPICGSGIGARGMGLVVVNTRMVEGIDLNTMKLKLVSGSKM